MKNAGLIADLLRSGLGVRFRATGTSMFPTIVPGENVVAEPVRAADLRTGDVVLFMIEGRLRAHRLVGIESDSRSSAKFVMRGDNLDLCDLPVDASAILGKLVCVERLWWKVPLSAPAPAAVAAYAQAA
jgi:hypothetical protein